MNHATPTIEAHTRFLNADVFNGLSRDELIVVLGVMHRILEASKKRDLERLIADLPAMFHRRTGARKTSSDALKDGLDTTPSNGERTYRVFHYVFSCLSRAQARMDTTRTGQVLIDTERRHLSPRELTVLLWMKEGKTNWEIARILGVSERTVRFHVGGIFEKLDVTSRTQAVARALGSGLIAS